MIGIPKWTWNISIMIPKTSKFFYVFCINFTKKPPICGKYPPFVRRNDQMLTANLQELPLSNPPFARTYCSWFDEIFFCESKYVLYYVNRYLIFPQCEEREFIVFPHCGVSSLEITDNSHTFWENIPWKQRFC